MKIGIITVYHPATNFGSFLQAYALKKYLEVERHQVTVITNSSPLSLTIKTCFLKLNPKRNLFNRWLKGWYAISDISRLGVKNIKKLKNNEFDLFIYGSDEIWNLEKSFFRDFFYWGTNVHETKKIAYAVSAGDMSYELLRDNSVYSQSIFAFNGIAVRDKHTQECIFRVNHQKFPIVCDPTLLFQSWNESINNQYNKEKYILVYTYGLEPSIVKILRLFSKENHLKIYSACFWHPWADKVIECSALHFSPLVAHAECVLTSTFHGAIFALLNHKKCCILPIKKKVKDLVLTLGEENRLITNDISYEKFSKVMNIPFDDMEFDERTAQIREYSSNCLNDMLSKIDNNVTK